MDELGLSNRGFAAILEPDDEKRRDTARVRISEHRNGKGMERATAERYAAGLTQAAGRTITADELLVSEAEAPASPESLALLASRVGEVEEQLELLVAEFRELVGFLRPPGAAPRSLPLPRQPSVEDC